LVTLVILDRDGTILGLYGEPVEAVGTPARLQEQQLLVGVELVVG